MASSRSLVRVNIGVASSFFSAAVQQKSITAFINIYIYILKSYILKECWLSTFPSSPFSPLLCARMILQSFIIIRLSCFLSSAVSHGDKDVQVEAVVRLPEEEDEDEAEETGAG